MEIILNIQSLLRQGIDCLVARHNCSPQEALEWIQQEARAKKASLDVVAMAILAGEEVHYRHDVPI